MQHEMDSKRLLCAPQCTKKTPEVDISAASCEGRPHLAQLRKNLAHVVCGRVVASRRQLVHFGLSVVKMTLRIRWVLPCLQPAMI